MDIDAEHKTRDSSNHTYNLRPRRPKSKSQSQQAFDFIDNACDQPITESGFRFSRGSLAYIIKPSNKWQEACPFIIVVDLGIVDGLQKEHFVIGKHINVFESVKNWQNNNDETILKVHPQQLFPNEIKIHQNKLDLIVNNPLTDVNSTQREIIKRLEKQLYNQNMDKNVCAMFVVVVM